MFSNVYARCDEHICFQDNVFGHAGSFRRMELMNDDIENAGKSKFFCDLLRNTFMNN